MPAPSAYNINWHRLTQNATMTVQPQRWEALQKRLRLLSRNGIANFVTGMLAAGPVPIATVAALDEAELRATYEGPLSAAFLALAGDVKVSVQIHVSNLLGDNAYVDPAGAAFFPRISGPEASLGAGFARYVDASVTTVLP